MFNFRYGRNVLSAVVLALAAPAVGCYADADLAPPAYAEGYEPQYYDGYVVYYDDGGRPYYYVNGGVYWVPPSSPVYVGLVSHWRHYGPAYHRWYAHYGTRYRGYRHPVHRR